VNVWKTQNAEQGLAVRTVKRFPHIHTDLGRCYSKKVSAREHGSLRGLIGPSEKAAAMANHASTRTTQLYDRRSDELSLDEVERIVI
jgi:hypothetical protein